MKKEYNGEIDGYIFSMKEENVIEVWDGLNEEFPHSFIYLKDGDIQNERDFHFEISDWWLKNQNS